MGCAAIRLERESRPLSALGSSRRRSASTYGDIAAIYSENAPIFGENACICDDDADLCVENTAILASMHLLMAAMRPFLAAPLTRMAVQKLLSGAQSAGDGGG